MTIIYSNLGDIDCRILETLWKGVEGAKVVELKAEDINKDGIEEKLEELMSKEEDTLIFAGHGISFGFPFPFLDDIHLILHSDNSSRIKARRVICIWCHASEFCETVKLKGSFSTSMYISNVEEAISNEVVGYRQRKINKTHGKFCRELRELILRDVPMEECRPLLQARVHPENEVDKFNRMGLKYIPSENT